MFPPSPTVQQLSAILQIAIIWLSLLIGLRHNSFNINGSEAKLQL